MQINASEEFPHLSHAQITEAVIEIRTRSSLSWKEVEILEKLKPQLVEYPTHRSVRGFEAHFQLTLGEEPKSTSQDLGWQGLMFTSREEKRIAKFQLDLFSFSQLHPYESWNRFEAEAFRLWKIHQNLTLPSEIQRLGVRFINRFAVTEKRFQVSQFLRVFPDILPDMDLIRSGFLHHDIFAVPDYPYAINVIRTIQPPEVTGKDAAIVLDVDVYLEGPLEPNNEVLHQRLSEMRWLKNKVFFANITEELMETLRE